MIAVLWCQELTLYGNQLTGHASKSLSINHLTLKLASGLREGHIIWCVVDEWCIKRILTILFHGQCIATIVL